MNFKKQLTLYLFFLSVPITQCHDQLPAFMINNVSLSDIVELIALYNAKNKYHTREIIFTANTMTNKASGMPDATFMNLYGTGLSICAWKLYPSSSVQDPIRTAFSIPKNFNPNGSLVLDLYLLTNKQSGLGNMANITVNMDYKSSNSEIGIHTPATGLSQKIDSESFTVIEPTQAANVYQMKVSIPLDATLAEGCDFAYMAITRTTPSGIEYSKNIYLSSATLRYE